MLLNPNDQWTIFHGDTIPHMLEAMPPRSVDFSVHSPPFPSLYAYSDSEADIGNVDAMGAEAKLHLSYYFRGLARVLKPGRVAMVHIMQIPKMKRTGESGLRDFRGLVIRIGERAGLIYEYDWAIRKNPQAQAIRTRSRELQFAGLESDRANTRGTLADYVIKFRAPGENEVAINAKGQVSRENWIKWAECCWDDIIETDTLNVAAGRDENDTKHICPLQLEVIRRLILLYTNPEEIVFSPFAGIGSEGFMAIGGTSPKTGRRIHDPRRFYGCELKDSYYQAAVKRLEGVKADRTEQKTLAFA